MLAAILWLMSPTLSVTLLSVPQRDSGTVSLPFAFPEADKPPQRMTRSLLTGGFPFGELCTKFLQRDMDKPGRFRPCNPSFEVSLGKPPSGKFLDDARRLSAVEIQTFVELRVAVDIGKPAIPTDIVGEFTAKEIGEVFP